MCSVIIQVSSVYLQLHKLFMYSFLCVYSSIYLCNQFAYYFMFLFTLLIDVVECSSRKFWARSI